MDQLDPNNPLYNVPRAIRLKGALNVEALRVALNEIVNRHEVLRTTYVAIENEPVQLIAPHVDIPVPVIDLSDIDATSREFEARRVVQQESEQPFDLAKDCGLRASLVKLESEDHVLLLNSHHIASDGWSGGILLNELATLYGAALEGKPSPLSELPIQYADYAVWQRNWLQGEVLDKQIQYWKKRLQGAPPVLALPSDRPRPDVPSFRGAVLNLTLPKNLTDLVGTLSRQEGATSFMTLLAAFQCLIRYYTNQDDVVLGTDLANRMNVQAEALIGFFVNLLVLRADLSGDPSFQDLIKRSREVALGAYAHQDVPFDILVGELRPERSLNYSPLVQVLFVQQNTPRGAAKMPGLDLSNFPLEVPSKFDMAVFVKEVAGSISANWLYNPDLFDSSTIARMSSLYQSVLEKVTADPGVKLGALMQLLSETEQQQRAAERKDFQEASLQKLKKIKRKVATGS